MKHSPRPIGRHVEKALEHADLLHRMLRLVIAEPNLDAFLGRALDELLAVSWLAILPKGGVFLADPETGWLRLTAQRNLGPQIQSLCARVRFGHCLCGRAALSGQAQHASCVDARHENRFEGMAPHGHYNVPLLAGSQVMGVLVVYLPEGHDRDESELQFLGSFAEILALVIGARLRSAEADGARKQRDSALRDTARLMDTIQRHTIFSQAAADGTITSVNDAFCAVTGYSREELIGSPHNMLNSGLHPPAFWESFWQTVLDGSAWRGEVCDRTKDGTLVWLDSIVMPFTGPDGQIERFVSIRTDVTERKRAEESLSRIGRILDGSSNEIYVFAADTLRFTEVNRGARKNLSYTLEEIRRLTPVDVKPEFDEARFRSMIAPLVSGTRDALIFETVHARSDGSTYPVSINLQYASEETPPVFVAIVQDITERRIKDDEITRLAFEDTLTGLANRAALTERIRALSRNDTAAAPPLWLLFFDLDRFKEINDTRGHGVGDRALFEVARRLGAVAQAAGMLARIGGDEFVLLVEGGDRDAIAALAERLRDAVKAPMVIEGKLHEIDTSIGIAGSPGSTDRPEDLLRLADIAMYEVKAEGGGHLFYDGRMGRRLARRLTMADRLREAILEDVLELHFQPIVALETGRLISAEALLRWTDPQLGPVGPGEFVAVAEERGMMPLLGAWVIDRCCRHIAAWAKDAGGAPGRVALNVSTRQMEDDTLRKTLREALDRYGLPPSALSIEVTESSMMRDPERSTAVLRGLKAMGLSVSIDDFGTGYSSLAYLKAFEADTLKIDMSFIRDLLDDANSLAIVSATVAMARGLGIRIVAEGVESMAQVTLLRKLGCDSGQGFLFDPALPADRFAARWLDPGSKSMRCVGQP